MTPLRQRMLDALQVRGMAVRTQQAYIDAVSRLARHYQRSPDTLTAEEVQHYLLHLLRERRCRQQEGARGQREIADQAILQPKIHQK